ncbi:hypothetical protein K443DRAFT_5636 [Laccaria amethystina LaAM-08-1]|uniref:Secreted protein n=1 Tax=Laccaria amethystina LaAM-08-1 TaxID=1095629 RepID=A0A0C9WUU8_9AGAR|nr:hypothetical protein K443DRAFT_5636 [Laccaria amethystina LaAM-08-1]
MQTKVFSVGLSILYMAVVSPAPLLLDLHINTQREPRPINVEVTREPDGSQQNLYSPNPCTITSAWYYFQDFPYNKKRSSETRQQPFHRKRSLAHNTVRRIKTSPQTFPACSAFHDIKFFLPRLNLQYRLSLHAMQLQSDRAVYTSD